MKLDIWANFKQYNLRFPEIMRIDALSNRLNIKPIFDAIICDEQQLMNLCECIARNRVDDYGSWIESGMILNLVSLL